MSTLVIAVLLVDLLVTTLLVWWILRRREARLSALERRVRDLESGRGLDTAAALQATRTPADAPHADGIDAVRLEPILRAIREGRTIEAVRLHRQATGLGLRESKDAVDALIRHLGA